MTNEKNEKVTPLNDETMENVAGGWLSIDKYDKYSKEEYKLAGIVWDHRIIGSDCYFYLNESRFVEQEEAEKITDEWFKAQGTT